jgi:hypothetical protein
MRRWAFVVAILGMFVLLFFLSYGEKEVDSLEGLEINQRVLVGGTVVEERAISGGRILRLENGIEVVCECVGSFKGREVSVIGIVSEFEGEKQVDVLRIAAQS